METTLPVLNKLAANPRQKPKYFKTLKQKNTKPIDVADPAAIRALIALMDMEAQLGGAASHFGGPAAFAEIMSVVHAVMFEYSTQKGVEWHQKFNFVNDAGHCENGLYALKALYGFADLTFGSLREFRSVHSKLTGHGEAHLFPEGVFISNGPLGSGLPQAQGLALADRLMGNERTTVVAISDGGCMEGEAREALAALPGLAANGKLNPFVMIISDNNTKLSGRIDKDSFSMAPTFASLKTLGWNVIRVEQGHDLQMCLDSFEDALLQAKSNPKVPVALHVKTIKGYGTKKTAESASGAHGFPLKKPEELNPFLSEIYSGLEVPSEFIDWMNDIKVPAASAKGASAPTEKVQVGIAKALIKMRKAGHPIVSISSDLAGSTGVADFQKEFPQYTQDLGVAESNMVSTAIGYSKVGFIPVVDTFSQFGATKGALPFIMAALSQGPMIAVFSHIGFQDAADGASHQALSYIAMLSSIPYTDVYVLSSSSEAEALMTQAIEKFSADRKAEKVPRSSVFFLGRENFPSSYLPADHNYEIGQAQVVFDNTSEHPGHTTIVAAGALLHQAIEAAYQLEKEKVGVVVVNPSIINTPDVNTIRSCLRNTNGRLITVDDHQIIGGMGSILIHALINQGIPVKAKSLGVDGEFGQSAYNAIELYRKHGLDSISIAEAVRRLISSTPE